MGKIVWVWVIAIGLVIAVGESASFAQFGGRGGIFGGMPRGGRGDRGENTKFHESRVERPAPDSYQLTEHNLMLLEVELHLTPPQQGSWQSFAQKVLAYANDLSRERARIGIPGTEGTALTGLQFIDQTTDGERGRLAELEDIKGAADTLYAVFSADQKKIADTRIATIIAPRPRVSAIGGGSVSGSDGASAPR